MFATGIENSIPTINGGRTRVDQMEACGPLRALARGLRLRRGDRDQFPPLRPAAAPDLPRPRQIRLGICRPDAGRSEAARHHADRRPLPLRRARLDRQFPEPRLSASSSPTTPPPSPSVILGPALHAGERDVHLRRLLAPNMAGGTSSGTTDLGVRHRAQAHRQGQCAGDDRDPEAPPRRHLHPVGIVGIFPRRQPRRDRPGRSAEQPPLPDARPQLRAAGRQRDVRISDG